MFSRAIENLAPWTDRGMFEFVDACTFSENGSRDYTMMATATALIERRVSEPFKIKLMNIRHDDSVSEDPVGVINNLLLSFFDDGQYDLNTMRNRVVISQYLGASDEETDRFMNSLDEKFLAANPDWERPEKSELFLKGYMKIRIFMQKERRTAILFTERLNMSKWHVLQSVMPTYIPDVFKELPLEHQEKVMLHMLTGRNVSNYLRELAALEENYDIRSKKIIAMIGDFEKRERRNQLQRIDNELDHIARSLEAKMNEYRELLRRRDDTQIRRNGMAYAVDNANDGADLISYFQAHKMLDLVGVDGSQIKFIVRTRFENFDLDTYETYRTNDNFLRESEVSGVFSDPEVRRKFMDAMFCTERIKVLLCAFYSLDIRCGVDTIRGYEFPQNCADYIPNYHLQHHHCLGNYERVINEYVNRGDTIGAIEACIASAKSINIAESGATFHPFMQEVFRSTKKCIELPDGTHVTPEKALEWINEQEAAQE